MNRSYWTYRTNKEMHILLQDLRYGFRMLLKQKGLTAVALLSMLGGFFAIVFAIRIKDGLLKVSVWGGRGISTLEPRLDWRVLTFTLALSVLTGIM